MVRPGPWLWPLLVGALTLATTGWLWQHEHETQTRLLRDNFDFGMRQTAARVEQRIASYEQMLRGVRGLFEASTLVTAADFAAYVDTLAAGADFAGLRSIAWAPLQRGPAGAMHAPVRFAAPAADMLVGRAGDDLLANPARSAALLQARDSGNLAATRRLLPAGGTGGDAGFLLCMPLYAHGLPRGTVAERRAALTGWVFASFGIGELMSSLYGEAVQGLDVRVHDGVDVNAGTQLHPAPVAVAAAPAPARFESQEYIAFAGHTWTLAVRSTPAFEQRHASDTAGVIAVAGAGLGAALALLAWQLATGRERANAAAQAMTRQWRESAERYRRIVETASEGIWLLDAELRTAFVNPKMAALLGTDAEALARRRWTDFMDEAGRERLGHAQAPGLRDRDAGQHDVRFLRADGSALWATVSASPIVGDDGRFAGALAMVTDVTERRELEERLRQSQKMEAVGTLAGGIAHDFNNLLAAILGNAALLADEVPAGGAAAERLAQVRRAAERGRSLVQQIVAFSRQQPQERVVQPLQPLVTEAAAMLRSTLPSGVTLELQLCETPLRVNADATQLQQVLLNLCTNAWHAMPESQGRILIGLDAEPPGPAPRRARLWVSDDGIGMDESTQRRVFEPFFTTKPVGKGTGLGLAVVHGIVTAHGGEIGVSSTPGAGTRFDLRLPLAEPVPALPPPPAAPAPAPHGGGRHVLVVDDDPVMLPVVQALLERAGFRVSAFADPRQALARGSATEDPVDIVVTDFNMPGLSGVALARALRLARPRLPVIISSGFVSEALRAEAQAAGVLHVLQKEYSLEQMQRLIHEALAAGPKPP